jgi:hypothetical protein
MNFRHTEWVTYTATFQYMNEAQLEGFMKKAKAQQNFKNDGNQLTKDGSRIASNTYHE